MISFLHSFLPSEILFSAGFITIHWYGFTMTLAIIAGFVVVARLFKQYHVHRDHVYNMGFYLVIFGIFGARMYHVLNEPVYYWNNPLEILSFWNGGIALHGALIAGVVVLYYYSKKHSADLCTAINKQQAAIKNKFLNPCLLFLTDVLAPAFILGQALGRWGNYFNQELYGLPTNASWGIPIALENRIVGFELHTHFHPTFLYESLLNFIVFGILIVLHKKRLRTSKEQPYKIGSITAWYLILYSLIRISMEFLRIDRTPILLGVRLPILASGLLIIVGIFLLVYTKRVNKLQRT